MPVYLAVQTLLLDFIGFYQLESGRVQLILYPEFLFYCLFILNFIAN